MTISINFENPSVISHDELLDVALVNFYNTRAYLKPQNDDLEVVPDGYRLKVTIPKQMRPELMEAQQSAEESLKGLVISNLFLSFLL